MRSTCATRCNRLELFNTSDLGFLFISSYLLAQENHFHLKVANAARRLLGVINLDFSLRFIVINYLGCPARVSGGLCRGSDSPLELFDLVHIFCVQLDYWPAEVALDVVLHFLGGGSIDLDGENIFFKGNPGLVEE